MEFQNKNEEYVAQLAVAHYREKLNEIKRSKESLSTKKFKYGEYVVKKGTSYFDGVFGTISGVIGKVIWFDEVNNYYRVRFDDHMSYVGIREDELELYTGEIPDHLANYNIDDSVYIQFKVNQLKGE